MVEVKKHGDCLHCCIVFGSDLELQASPAGSPVCFQTQSIVRCFLPTPQVTLHCNVPKNITIYECFFLSTMIKIGVPVTKDWSSICPYTYGWNMSGKILASKQPRNIYLQRWCFRPHCKIHLCYGIQCAWQCTWTENKDSRLDLSIMDNWLNHRTELLAGQPIRSRRKVALEWLLLPCHPWGQCTPQFESG
jgi:hypothetical protein